MQWYVKNYKRSYCAVLSGILSNFLAYFYLEVAEAGTLLYLLWLHGAGVPLSSIFSI